MCLYPDGSEESQSSIRMTFYEWRNREASEGDYRNNQLMNGQTWFPQKTKVINACYDSLYYQLEGSKERICQSNQTWSGTPPRCS